MYCVLVNIIYRNRNKNLLWKKQTAGKRHWSGVIWNVKFQCTSIWWIFNLKNIFNFTNNKKTFRIFCMNAHAQQIPTTNSASRMIHIQFKHEWYFVLSLPFWSTIHNRMNSLPVVYSNPWPQPNIANKYKLTVINF